MTPHSPPNKRQSNRLGVKTSFMIYSLLSATAFLLGAYRSVVDELSTTTTHHQQTLLLQPLPPASSSPSSLSYNIRDKKIDPNCSLAYQQSYGYFYDIPNHQWLHLQRIAQSAGTYENRHDYDPNYSGNDDDDTYWNAMPPNIFYGRNYDPNFSCRFAVRVGGLGDGGKFVCDPHRISEVARLGWSASNIDDDDDAAAAAAAKSIANTEIERKELGEMPKKSYNNKNNINKEIIIDAKPNCLVYSIGSAGNFRFEYGLQTLLGPNNHCEIHVFDITDYSSLVPRQMNIHFHPWGLRRDHGPNTNDDYSPDENVAYSMIHNESNKYRSLPETIKSLGHSGKTIDILKIDCEGCEWKTYVDWIRGTSLDGTISIPPPRQVLVEMHRSPAPYARDFMEGMRKAGYVIFHKEPNIEGCRGDCVEYGFLRLHPDFYL